MRILGLSRRLLHSRQLIENVWVFVDLCGLHPQSDCIAHSILGHANAPQVLDRIGIPREDLFGPLQSVDCYINLA